MRRLLLLILFLAVSTFRCSLGPVAGGTTDTGNAKVAAVIYTSDGRPASGASVVLVPSDYLPETDGTDRLPVEIFTDDSGMFHFDSIESGKHCIEINDGDSSSILLNITVYPDEEPIVINDTLKPYASIEGNAGITSDTSSKRFLLIYGLDRIVPVSTDGSFYADNLPGGTFIFRIISQDSAWTPIEIEAVTNPSQTTLIPQAGWVHNAAIYLNTTESGANVTENIFGFPVLIRLSEDNFSFSEADEGGKDIRFFKTDGTPVDYEIEQWDLSLKRASIWVNIDTVYGNLDKQYVSMHWGNPNAASLSNSKAVFDTSEGFFGCYHLGGNTNDATANGFEGTNNGTTDFQDGIAGSGRLFDGRSYIDLGDLPDRLSGTISFWFRPGVLFDSNSITQGIWGKKTTDSLNFSLSLRGIDYYIDSTVVSLEKGCMISKMEAPREGYYLKSESVSFDAQTWYYASWSWGDGSNSLYINGSLEASVPSSVAVSGSGSDEIGRCIYDSSNLFTGPRFFYGALDEFRIESTPRDSSWVRLCYMNQRTDDKLARVGK